MFLGSVNGGNSAELAKKEDIDGFLVGGASLKVHGFFKKNLTLVAIPLMYHLQVDLVEMQGPEFATIVNSVTSKKVAA